MKDPNVHCAEAQMLIRKPAAIVFQAFIDPAVTTCFWFTKSTGKLEVNKKVTWEWEMYQITKPVTAIEILPDEKIVFEWEEEVRTVEFHFRELSDHSTFVTVKECGYKETGEELLPVIKGSTEGFTTVLDSLKAFLEHGIQLNLVGDKFPKEVFGAGALR